MAVIVGNDGAEEMHRLSVAEQASCLASEFAPAIHPVAAYEAVPATWGHQIKLSQFQIGMVLMWHRLTRFDFAQLLRGTP